MSIYFNYSSLRWSEWVKKEAGANEGRVWILIDYAVKTDIYGTNNFNKNDLVFVYKQKLVKAQPVL